MNSKKFAAEKALSFVSPGMTIGLGTGSTSEFAIEMLGSMVRSGFSIKAVASSLRSESLAKQNAIPIVSFSEVKDIDMYIDGADEVDPDFNLIKGGGGAHLREKILAYTAREFVVIVDHSKLVPQLGKFPLPVEVVPFASELTSRHLEVLGCVATLRKNHGVNFITDNGNFIFDCGFRNTIDPDDIGPKIRNIPGVVEHGLFPKKVVSKVLVGFPDGKVEIHTINSTTQR